MLLAPEGGGLHRGDWAWGGRGKVSAGVLFHTCSSAGAGTAICHLPPATSHGRGPRCSDSKAGWTGAPGREGERGVELKGEGTRGAAWQPGDPLNGDQEETARGPVGVREEVLLGPGRGTQNSGPRHSAGPTAGLLSEAGPDSRRPRAPVGMSEVSSEKGSDTRLPPTPLPHTPKRDHRI